MSFQNPIIPGFAPDPSITRIGDTFFLVNSSFHLFPGLPIFASTDLISWTHIGNAINRTSQLELSSASTTVSNMEGLPDNRIVATAGLYAPTIRHHMGKTYIVCTNMKHIYHDRGSHQPAGIKFQNFIISTEDIRSDTWSDPVFFDFWGIDPDLFIDDDGHVYITGSSWNSTPGTINCFEIDLETGEKLSPERVIWEGFSKIIPEGPHIYKRNGWYYLLDSEGGTHEGHQICISRSESVWGPFENCPQNPILPPTSELASGTYIQNNGHGDIFQDNKDAYWIICLAIRKDLRGRSIMGRETFLAPVHWAAGDPWPIIQQPLHIKPDTCLVSQSPSRLSVAQIDTLCARSAETDLVWIRDPDFGFYQIIDGGQIINIKPSKNDLGDRTGPVSFVGRRQRYLEGQSKVTLRLQGHEIEKLPAGTVGLAYYKDEYRYAFIAYDYVQSAVVFEMKNAARVPIIRAYKKHSTIALAEGQESGTDVTFCIKYTEQSLEFGYYPPHPNQDEWISVATVDTLDLTDRDFTGPCIGVFATTRTGARVTERVKDYPYSKVTFYSFNLLSGK